jgi:hypothetical protein
MQFPGAIPVGQRLMERIRLPDVVLDARGVPLVFAPQQHGFNRPSGSSLSQYYGQHVFASEVERRTQPRSPGRSPLRRSCWPRACRCRRPTRLGHSSVRTTQKTHAHLITGPGRGGGPEVRGVPESVKDSQYPQLRSRPRERVEFSDSDNGIPMERPLRNSH